MLCNISESLAICRVKTLKNGTDDPMYGNFSEETLELLVEISEDFSETHVMDFTRCQRPDGSFYGTSGTCRKGSQTGAREKEAPRTAGGRKRRATAEAKVEAKAASRAEAGKKISAKAGRASILREELEKVKDQMRGASPEEQNRLLQQASAAADNRAKAAAPNSNPKLSARVERAMARKANDAEGEKQANQKLKDLAAKDKRIKIAAAGGQAKVDAGKLKKIQEALDEMDRRLDKDESLARNEVFKTKRAKLENSRRTLANRLERARQADKPEAARQSGGGETPASAGKKPRATTAETKPKWQEAEKAVKEAKSEFKRVTSETKGDKSPEAQKRRLEAGRALDRAERAAEKASDRYLAAAKRESYKAMTPEQKKEEREWRKTQKRLG